MESSIFVDIFNDLLAERGLNYMQFSAKSGIPYSTVIGWVKHNRLPDYTALIKIADFFNCTIDYLAGRQDEFGNAAYTAEILHSEFEYIRYFRRLDSENQKLIIALTKNLAKK